MNILRRMGARAGWLTSGAAACCLLALLAPSFAMPLDKKACAKLAQDMRNMKMLEVDKLMRNGAVWAATHLSATDLNLVRQYIDLDEQLKFRCSAPSSLVRLKQPDDKNRKRSPKHARSSAKAKKSRAQRKAANARTKKSPAHTKAQ